MGEFTDCAICAWCAKEIKAGEKVVVIIMIAGLLCENGDVSYDSYDKSKEIYHEDCYQEMVRAI